MRNGLQRTEIGALLIGVNEPEPQMYDKLQFVVQAKKTLNSVGHTDELKVFQARTTN
jgi:hypothetical protein